MRRMIDSRERIRDTIILTTITTSPIIAIILITKIDPMLEYMANKYPKLWAAIMAPIGIVFGVTLVITYILSLLIISVFRKR
jgi:sensor c-di-GMP phosphodiesterase-like protein